MPKELTQAEKDAQARVDKAAWMNDQLAERLPDADYVQPGVAPAKDARVEGEYPVAGSAPKGAAKPAADKS